MSIFKKIIVENHYKKNFKQRKIICRSNWEMSFISFLERNDKVKEWVSEYPIKYFDTSTVPNKIRKYYIDFFVTLVDGHRVFFEVKPLSNLQERVNTKSMRYKHIHTTNYLKNVAKFNTLQSFCQRSGMNFYIVEKKETHFNFYEWDIKTKSPVFIHI
jgi:hypothetical protein